MTCTSYDRGPGTLGPLKKGPGAMADPKGRICQPRIQDPLGARGSEIFPGGRPVDREDWARGCGGAHTQVALIKTYNS